LLGRRGRQGIPPRIAELEEKEEIGFANVIPQITHQKTAKDAEFVCLVCLVNKSLGHLSLVIESLLEDRKRSGKDAKD
jgi:hypothetical protein